MAGKPGSRARRYDVPIVATRFTVPGMGKRPKLAVLAMSAIFGLIVLGLMQANHSAGQVLHANGPLPSFEVASIKPNHSGNRRSSIGAAGRGGAPMDRFIDTNTTLKMLISWAFAGSAIALPMDQVTGGPDWINSERYDIDAKIEDAQAAALSKLPGPDQIVQVRLMVQSLLADRFKLVAKDTMVMRPVYALVIAKDGSKLQETVPGSPSPIISGGRQMQAFFNLEEIRGHGLSMSGLARGLSGSGLDRPVLDQTGLKGAYNIDLKWTPDMPSSAGMVPGSSSGAEPAPPDAGPSIFTAIQEQLGLKLEPVTGPVEAIVIEHIEKPTEN